MSPLFESPPGDSGGGWKRTVIWGIAPIPPRIGKSAHRRSTSSRYRSRDRCVRSTPSTPRTKKKPGGGRANAEGQPEDASLVHMLLQAALEPHLRLVRKLFPRRGGTIEKAIENDDSVECRRGSTLSRSNRGSRHHLLWRFAIETCRSRRA